MESKQGRENETTSMVLSKEGNEYGLLVFHNHSPFSFYFVSYRSGTLFEKFFLLFSGRGNDFSLSRIFLKNNIPSCKFVSYDLISIWCHFTNLHTVSVKVSSYIVTFVGAAYESGLNHFIWKKQLICLVCLQPNISAPSSCVVALLFMGRK